MPVINKNVRRFFLVSNGKPFTEFDNTRQCLYPNAYITVIGNGVGMLKLIYRHVNNLPIERGMVDKAILYSDSFRPRNGFSYSRVNSLDESELERQEFKDILDSVIWKALEGHEHVFTLSSPARDVVGRYSEFVAMIRDIVENGLNPDAVFDTSSRVLFHSTAALRADGR